MDDKLNIRVDDVGFSVRVKNLLKNNKCFTFGDVVKLKEIEIKNKGNFGQKSLNELNKVLHSHGLSLQVEIKKHGWNYIETAPKDGTDVLIIDDDWITIGWWDGEDWCRQNLHLSLSNPTHWMPLPNPPKEK